MFTSLSLRIEFTYSYKVGNVPSDTFMGKSGFPIFYYIFFLDCNKSDRRMVIQLKGESAFMYFTIEKFTLWTLSLAMYPAAGSVSLDRRSEERHLECIWALDEGAVRKKLGSTWLSLA